MGLHLYASERTKHAAPWEVLHRCCVTVPCNMDGVTLRCGCYFMHLLWEHEAMNLFFSQNTEATWRVHAIQVLLSMFADVCTPGGPSCSFLSNPYTCATAADLIGVYAAWFGQQESAPLEGALQLLLHALKFPLSWDVAAKAFRALCGRCSARLNSSVVLMGLMDVAARAVAPAPSAGQVSCLQHCVLIAPPFCTHT